MTRTLISLQVFLLMCAPLPQASYVGVAVGRNAGLAIVLILALYTLSDLLALLLIATVVRRVQLPGRLGQWVARTAARAEQIGRGPAALPALFAIGYASLYAVGVIAGLSRLRPARVIVVGLAGDLFQFTTTVALGGLLAALLPFPGASWAVVAAAPVLTVTLVLGGRAGHTLTRFLRGTMVRPDPCAVCAGA